MRVIALPSSTAVTATALLLLAIAGRPRSVEAQGQPRDFMLDFQPEGSFVFVDHVGTGAMLSLEHRERMYGASNDVTVGAVALASYPMGELSLRADLRILFLGLGGMVGYRADWRSLTFEGTPDRYCIECDRRARRVRDKMFEGSPGSDTYAVADGRATLFLPLNDHLVGMSTVGLRYEDRLDRSYDWIYASIYDGGLITRWETLFFLKHRDLGGIGPYVQMLWLPRAGGTYGQFAYGFNAVTRPGLLPRNDLLFLTFLTRLNDPEYGQHNYYSPLRALLVYRMIFQL